MLTLRAEHTVSGHALTADDYLFHGDAAGALRAFDDGSQAWREALVSADRTALDEVGHSGYPDGSDPEEPFINVLSGGSIKNCCTTALR
jgi:hypothetical protein